MSELFGLVLAGGRSTRMRVDKAALAYRDGRPQLQVAYGLVAGLTARAFVSVRADQAAEPLRAALPQVVDGPGPAGPMAGILAAQAAHPGVAWLVVACDLPRLGPDVLAQLVARRDPAALATAWTGSDDGLPEPLCAIWEPASAAPLAAFAAGGGHCPRRFLRGARVTLLGPPPARALDNVNTPAEHAAALAALAGGAIA